MPTTDDPSQGSDALEGLLNSPALRPAIRYLTTAFTIWQRKEGPAIQLELLQPPEPLLRSNLAVLDEGTAKRNVPLKLTLQPTLATAPEVLDCVGALRFEKAGRVAELGANWGDHIVGSVTCGVGYLDRLIGMLAQFECQVEWVLTTQHIDHESYAPISDLLWDPENLPVLSVHNLSARVTRTSDPVATSESIDRPLPEYLPLLRQIVEALKTGVRIRFF